MKEVAKKKLRVVPTPSTIFMTSAVVPVDTPLAKLMVRSWKKPFNFVCLEQVYTFEASLISSSRYIAQKVRKRDQDLVLHLELQEFENTTSDSKIKDVKSDNLLRLGE